VNDHFLNAFSEEEREKGLFSLAPHPPMGNMVSELWDRHMRKGYRKDRAETLSPEKQAEMMKRFKEFRKRPTLAPDEFGTAEDEMISITRSVRRKRGSWWQVPKDMPAPQDDD
jgi:hypothetical protein